MSGEHGIGNLLVIFSGGPTMPAAKPDGHLGSCEDFVKQKGGSASGLFPRGERRSPAARERMDSAHIAEEGHRPVVPGEATQAPFAPEGLQDAGKGFSNPGEDRVAVAELTSTGGDAE